jgi:MoCo/4Fe-4S cofactor protein with predicted Tat translocation signal
MRNPETERLDLEAIRRRLAGTHGETFWRSLEELAEGPEFRDYLEHEFPEQADTWADPVSRRKFLKLMGASFALAGLAACARQPEEKIVPYVQAPEELIPGQPLYYATALPFRGYGLGVLVRSDMGRPNKVEGNPQHPASLGAADIFAQASVLALYDPDRAQVVRFAGEISTWENFTAAAARALEEAGLRDGDGLRLLTRTVTSPTLAGQIRGFLSQFPQARWHQWEGVNRDSVRLGARQAFGEFVEVRYRFDRADVILALDSDFLTEEPGSVRYARDFAARRRVRQGGSLEMNRLYAVEGMPTVTGAMADHRLPLRPGAIPLFARELARRLGVPGAGSPKSGSEAATPFLGLAEAEKWLAETARDLQAHRGSSLVVPGERQPAAVHALAHAINQALGNAGRTVVYTNPVEVDPTDQLQSIRDLAADMDAGKVQLLIILDGNPVYDAPADLDFAARLAKVRTRIHFSLYANETAELCHWHVPATHPLETWSDVRAWDGTATILQPLIAPLYDGRSAHEFVAALSGTPDARSHDIVKESWRRMRPSSNFEMFWKRTLNDGFVADTAFPEKAVALRPFETDEAEAGAQSAAHPPQPGSLELVFRPDPCVWDGRFANNGWLQELPKPITKLTWDNAVHLGPGTAERLGIDKGDVLILTVAGRSLRAPAWIVPGHPDGAVTVHLGYGRTRAGRVGDGAGFNAGLLRRSDGLETASGLELQKTGEKYALASTQTHQNMEGRELVRVATLAQFLKKPGFAQAMGEPVFPEETLYPGFPYEGYKWGMSIDTNACIGCNACVVACQSENNSPVVGKEQVLAQREMHWIRIDRYFAGSLESPRMYAEPVPCMHCENAPCELVCPVGATVHSTEGLNEMIYNRCVGTRYCSNNCPYKVRRFNFLLYSDEKTPSRALLYNPNVTVRTRGVMEKCSYCVQRIAAAKIDSEKEMRRIKDGEVVPACAQTCPTEAIVFGDMNDRNSRVSLLKAQPLDYGLLTELNTRPRTTYLAKLRNPNPALEQTA